MKFKKTNQKVKTPVKSHLDDAGWDLFSPEDVSAGSFETITVNLGIAIEIPKGYFGFISERSSQGKKGITCLGPIIDSGYTGEIHAILLNSTNRGYEIKEGDKICQLIVIPLFNEELEEVDKLTNSPRSNKGLGSTGI